MSNSRLEKFIYAICSMEVSDLPAPLSRIEKLWNCLITGETPDFEPLSRNEKYLMAMLDRYDISNLPAPISRGEKLLYKIAVGETDLSDVPGYLSRYEELLKYLIENGGISGGDFEYVLHTINQSMYTLYTTAEKPVKSAILKGNTLVNLLTQNSSTNTYTTRTQIDRGYRYTQQYSASMTATRIQWYTTDEGHNRLKPNTKYYVQFTVKVNKGRNVRVSFEGGSEYATTLAENSTTTIKCSVRCGESLKRFFVYIYPPVDESYIDDTFDILDFMTIEYQEGMENWDIPYFEGMQSVKMPVLTTTGKNLFRGLYSDFNQDGWGSFKYGNIGEYYTVSIYDKDANVSLDGISFGVSVKGDEYNTLNWITNGNTVYINSLTTNNKNSFTIQPNNEETLNKILQRFNIQIEQGSTATSYEPYKSNILSTPSDLVLRGIGEVQDTLDCLTGEVTERIGEVVYDGSDDENWDVAYINVDGLIGIATNIPSDMKYLGANRIDGFINDRLKQAVSENMSIYSGYGGWRMFAIYMDSSTFDSAQKIKQWLSQNPITVQYELDTESIKTVDLTTVDQDGQPTKLKTYNDITHVEIKADNLIPSVDLEVATKINEALSTMGPQQLDISNTQNKLGQTIDEQTENTDATMMATTEIYEQTL